MNSQTINKTIGYGLLIAGLLLIILPLYQTYNIFTGNAAPTQVFKQEKIETNDEPNNPFNIQQQVQKGLANMLPIDAINNILNLGSWMILMWILMLGGGKLAGLGIQLLTSNT